jgi:Flp pilus assembly protein TadG
LVEFAFCLPLFFLLVMSIVQLGLIVLQEYSLQRVTRETTRWLAIYPNTPDTCTTNANGLLDSGCDNAGTIAANQGTCGSTPARCSVRQHAQSNSLTMKPGRITVVSTSPACASMVTVSGVLTCTSRSTSTPVTVTLHYDMQDWVFFANRIKFAGQSIGFPTTYTYSVTVMQER